MPLFRSMLWTHFATLHTVLVTIQQKVYCKAEKVHKRALRNGAKLVQGKGEECGALLFRQKGKKYLKLWGKEGIELYLL